MGQEKLKEFKTPLEALQDIINDAPIVTEGEFLRTMPANSWLACFGSSLFRVETGLLIARRHIGDKYEPAQQRIEGLKTKVRELMIRHSSNWVPNHRLMHKLFEELNVLAEPKKVDNPS